MKRLFLVLFASACVFAADAQTLLPIRDSVGKLSVSVDPRMELLGAVQIVARYQMQYLCNTRGTPYSNRVQAYFGAFANSDAVKCTRDLSDLGFAFDAPPGFMLYCSDLPELNQLQPYSEYLKGRAHGEKELKRYEAALKNFAKKSRFTDFWTENADFYRQVLSWGKRGIGNVDIIHVLESYYNMDQGSYHLIMCPLFGSCNYATSIPDSDDRQHIYALVCVPQNPDGTLPDKGLDLMKMLLHEFSHSFVNPAAERYSDLVAQSSDRFEPIREKMSAQAYPYWNICVNEHIVRAVVIRILETLNGPEDTEKHLQTEEQNSFLYIRPVVARLREYEALRNSKGITFADYMPELLKAFSEAERYTPRFQGPLNAVLTGDNVIFVHPTVGDGAAKTTAYVRSMAEWINSRSQSKKTLRLVADSVAVKMPLDSCSIVCYGTVENNLLLAKYRSKLPFRVEKGAIIADRRYDDPAVRLIVCMPNPENPERGMAVYTAIDEGRIPDINNVFHGPEDFCVFIDRDHVLSRGYLEKSGGAWRFPQPQP